MIPKDITREHILKAIDEIDKTGYNKNRESTEYHLKYNSKIYPPKAIISRAYKFVNDGNEEWDSSRFSGGLESNTFLISRGFEIINNLGQGVGYNVQSDEEENIQSEHFAPRLRDFLKLEFAIEIKDIVKSRL